MVVAAPFVEFAWDVLTLAPAPRTSVWRFVLNEDTGGVRLEQRFEMAALPDGLRAMLVRAPVECRATLLAAREQALRDGIETTLDRLKHHLEGGPPSS